MTIALAMQQVGGKLATAARRLQRGSLRGVPIERRWRLLLPDGLRQAVPTWHRGRWTVEADRTVVRLLEDEVGYLRKQLTGAKQERAELRRLVAQSQAIMAHLVMDTPSPPLASSPLGQKAAEPAGLPPASGTAPSVTGETLEQLIARYEKAGWHVRVRLDNRVELVTPAGPQRVYLEAQANGTVAVKYVDGSAASDGGEASTLWAP
jgi:hypothetical protein